MKRYRVTSLDFDTRAYVLSLEIKENWEERIKEQWANNKRGIREGIVAEYGAINFQRKIDDFIELGSIPFSIVAFHNKFIRQARDAFTIGSYYPCLTASCALGERILNHLIIRLRGYYKSSPKYKKVYRKNSFDNWDIAIDTLKSWEILLPDVAEKYRELKEIRNQALHFNPETDEIDRELSLEAFKKMCEVIKGQFGTGVQPWFIEGINGAAIVKKEYEDNPFVKEVVVPQSMYVGYDHKLERKDNLWNAIDRDHYEETELTDEEFKELFNNRDTKK